MSGILSDAKKAKSFDAVRSFMEAADRPGDSFQGLADVSVQRQTEEIFYQRVRLFISYQHGYMDYKVALIWEDDKNQPDYHSIGLHGEYSTNFQEFSFSNGALSFWDGGNRISIFASR